MRETDCEIIAVCQALTRRFTSAIIGPGGLALG
jgi:hypothetical protein